MLNTAIISMSAVVATVTASRGQGRLAMILEELRIHANGFDVPLVHS